MHREFNLIIERITQKDTRYKEDVYAFVMEALGYTQQKFKITKHVTGPELLEGMKLLLLNKYGAMTTTVLEYWGVTSTEDFGNIIFNLVDSKVLSKTEDDKIDHFRNGYDFQEVFEHGYRKQLNRKIKRMRSM